MKTYQITLIHWLSRKKVNIKLGNTINDAKEKLKVVRKKYSRMWWLKNSPIHC